MTSRRALALQLEYYCELRKGDTVSIDLNIEIDRKRIDNPMGWPHMRLPLRNSTRGSGLPELGWLFTHMQWQGPERIVFLGNIFEAQAQGTEAYESTQALLDAGWRVD